MIKYKLLFLFIVCTFAVCANAPETDGRIETRTSTDERDGMEIGPGGVKTTSAVPGSVTTTDTLDVLLIVINVSRSLSHPESVPTSIVVGDAVTVTTDVNAFTFTRSVSEQAPAVNGNLATSENAPAPLGDGVSRRGPRQLRQWAAGRRASTSARARPPAGSSRRARRRTRAARARARRPGTCRS